MCDHLIDCLRDVADNPFIPEPTSASLLLHKLKCLADALLDEGRQSTWMPGQTRLALHQQLWTHTANQNGAALTTHTTTTQDLQRRPFKLPVSVLPESET
jgi:hypothetical protein